MSRPLVAQTRCRRQSGTTVVETRRPKADVGDSLPNAIATGRIAGTALYQTLWLINESKGLDVPPAATFSTCV